MSQYDEMKAIRGKIENLGKSLIDHENKTIASLRELEDRVHDIIPILDSLVKYVSKDEFSTLDNFVNHLTQDVQGVKKDLEKRYYDLEGMIDDIRNDIPYNCLTTYDLDKYVEQHEIDRLDDRVEDLEKRISDLE